VFFFLIFFSSFRFPGWDGMLAFVMELIGETVSSIPLRIFRSWMEQGLFF
jgi:hypothetical protein